MLKPLRDQVVIIPKQKEQKTKSGVILTQAQENAPQIGKVIAIGGEVESVAVGEYVVFESFSGLTFEPEDDNLSYVILEETSIVAIYEAEG